MSPPLDLAMVPGRIAYAISKLGMTLLTHGLAEEVRPHNIAVNSLWPVTIIESQASINWGLGTREAWRKPDILVDCVLRLVRKEPGEITGRGCSTRTSCAEGVTDFGGYACVPGTSRRGCRGRRFGLYRGGEGVMSSRTGFGTGRVVRPPPPLGTTTGRGEK